MILLCFLLISLKIKPLFFFDDLERCKLPLEELLGYLQRLIYEGRNYLILVANEAEIRNNLSKEAIQKYQEAKVKTIGKELTLEYDFDFLYENLVNELPFPMGVSQKTQESYPHFLKERKTIFIELKSFVKEVKEFSLEIEKN